MKDGGQAFPMIKRIPPYSYDVENYGGMTLRDYFAGQALGLAGQLHTEFKPEELSRDCYKYADAMITERSK